METIVLYSWTVADPGKKVEIVIIKHMVHT